MTLRSSIARAAMMHPSPSCTFTDDRERPISHVDANFFVVGG